jgi:tetratricopeptide (TPR) repeat protein
LRRGILIFIVLCLISGGVLYKLFGKPAGGGNNREELAKQAREALEAVKERDVTPSSTLRIAAPYDAILAPLDKLLGLAREAAEGEERNPIEEYDRIRATVQPVLDIAPLAHAQSQTETGTFRKDYRFMAQKGEACQLLASALWNRLEAVHRQSAAGREGGRFVPEPADTERLYAILRDGLEADPGNKALWHVRALVERVNGAFGRAESDLRRALSLDSQFVPAWNDLGLTLINLRRFDEAGEAFANARDRAAAAAKSTGRPVGPEYAAALLNLADFHLGLAEHYRREMGVDPGDRDNQDRLKAHLAGAAEATKELLDAMPPDSPEAVEARRQQSRITY